MKSEERKGKNKDSGKKKGKKRGRKLADFLQKHQMPDGLLVSDDDEIGESENIVKPKKAKRY